MKYTITINADSDSIEAVEDIVAAIEHIAPYVLDNVVVTSHADEGNATITAIGRGGWVDATLDDDVPMGGHVSRSVTFGDTLLLVDPDTLRVGDRVTVVSGAPDGMFRPGYLTITTRN